VTLLSKIAKEEGIRYFLVSFADLRGVQRAKLVPAAAIDRIAEEGAGFAGFATWLDMTPADADMLAMPDPKSLTRLPWKPEVAWLAGELVMNGKPVEQAPRRVLMRQLQRARELGYVVKSGVECEFFVLNADGTAIGDANDLQAKPCYDQQALMRRYDLITKICDSMLALGWGPYQNDHEDANGQFEMNWTYSDAATTADRHAFFKYMVKTLAESAGLRATFMPKPFSNLSGNGCHVHLSLWDDEKNENQFRDRAGELGLSRTAYEFMGGVPAAHLRRPVPDLRHAARRAVPEAPQGAGARLPGHLHNDVGPLRRGGRQRGRAACAGRARRARARRAHRHRS
jgi:glutamine synthetase